MNSNQHEAGSKPQEADCSLLAIRASPGTLGSAAVWHFHCAFYLEILQCFQEEVSHFQLTVLLLRQAHQLAFFVHLFGGFFWALLDN